VLWPGILFLVALVLVVALLVIKVLWAWTVPDLLPGAVAQGLVAGSISWLTSFNLALFVAVMTGLFGLGRGHKSERKTGLTRNVCRACLPSCV